MNVVFITNILTPYRMHFYDLLNYELSKSGDTVKVLVMLKEDHNAYWNYNTYKREYTELIPCHYIGKYGGEFFINTGLKKRIDKNNPDIIVLCGSYWYPSLIYISSIYKKKAKILYWSESNKVKLETRKGVVRSIREYIRKTQFNKYDGFLYPGELAKELILDYNPSPAYMICLPNIVDETKYKYDRKKLYEADHKRLCNDLGLDVNKKIFFCPARLVPEKGLIEFFDSVEKSTIKKNATFVIAGAGPLEDSILQTADEKEIDIQLVGILKESQMIEYYHVADMFFLPSLSDPSPLACVEALWSELPLLISDRVGNMREVLEEGVNGFSFNVLDNNEALLDKIDTLTQDWFISAGERSHNLATKNFLSVRKTEEVIESFRSISIQNEERNK